MENLMGYLRDIGLMESYCIREIILIGKDMDYMRIIIPITNYTLNNIIYNN
jgi:hypothetical protein